MNINEIDPGIKPLVDALNQTGLVHTFSSCEGHFDEIDRFNDHRRASVLFELEDNVTPEEIEIFLTYIVTEYNRVFSCNPITLNACKNYPPILSDDKPERYDKIDHIYTIELVPFDQGILPSAKREHLDLAISRAVQVVENYLIELC